MVLTSVEPTKMRNPMCKTIGCSPTCADLQELIQLSAGFNVSSHFVLGNRTVVDKLPLLIRWRPIFTAQCDLSELKALFHSLLAFIVDQGPHQPGKRLHVKPEKSQTVPAFSIWARLQEKVKVWNLAHLKHAAEAPVLPCALSFSYSCWNSSSCTSSDTGS